MRFLRCRRLNQSMGTKVDVPQGGVVWVFAVK